MCFTLIVEEEIPLNRPSQRLSWRLFTLGVLSGVLTLVLAYARRHGVIPPRLMWLAALGPVLPMAAYFWGLDRLLRGLDEMQRLIHLEALFIQFGVTAFLVLCYGALAEAGVLPNYPIGTAWPWVWLLMFGSWALGQIVVRRKYR